MDFSGILSLNFVVILFAFLFVDMFDTIGTLIGVSTKAGMLDKDGKLPRIKGALLADAVGTTAGAVLGVSTTTTFVESASGVSEGGRNRSDFHYNRRTVCTVSAVIPDLPCHPVFRDRSGTGNRRILHADKCGKHQL